MTEPTSIRATQPLRVNLWKSTLLGSALWLTAVAPCAAKPGVTSVQPVQPVQSPQPVQQATAPKALPKTAAVVSPTVTPTPQAPAGSKVLPNGALPTATLKPITVVPAVKGFADLHAHPAAHLAFGAASSGSGKLFAGVPGSLRSNIAVDLAPCSSEHFWDDADIVRSMTRTQIRDAMDAGAPHGRSGAPEFRDWPAARSVIHQQMHTTWVYRAYQGGLRLMVASLSDNQTLAMLWNRHQGASAPSFDPNADFEVAKREAAFIQSWARDNSSWMQIVTTPAEARTVINSGKLALILGTEMDTLTTAQILTLARTYKVRLVIPIHFANNQFGGPAVYGDLFNTNNRYLTGSFYSVTPDSHLAFHLNTPQYLRYVDHTEVDDAISFFAGMLTMGTIGMGAMKPTLDTSVTYPAGGQRNSRPLNTAEMHTLLHEGLLIDTAHMSQIAQQGVLTMTRDSGYPVLNSHSGLRPGAGPAESERSMRNGDARTMADRGGVLGIGTVGDNQTAVLVDATTPAGASDFVRLTASTREWTQARRRVRDPGYSFRYVRVTLTTGDDDKRDNEGAWAVITTRTGRQEFDLVPERGGLAGNHTVTKTFPLSPDLRVSDVLRVGVRHDTAQYFKDGQYRDYDNWNIRALEIELLPDPVSAWASDAAADLHALGDRGIALGTDFNGLEKQMPGLPTIQMTYPVDIVQRFAPNMRLAGGTVPPTLNQQVSGSRTFDLRNDGLAQYGMLPDFLQAVSRAPGGEAVVASLFDGAEAVIRLWEKVETAKTAFP